MRIEGEILFEPSTLGLSRGGKGKGKGPIKQPPTADPSPCAVQKESKFSMTSSKGDKGKGTDQRPSMVDPSKRTIEAGLESSTTSTMRKRKRTQSDAELSTPWNINFDAIAYVPSKKSTGWTVKEQRRCGELMQEALNQNPKLGESRWKEISDRLMTEGFNKGPGAVKNWWNRNGRAIHNGMDAEKLNGGPRALSTSNRTGAPPKKRAFKKNPERNSRRITNEESEDDSDDNEEPEI